MVHTRCQCSSARGLGLQGHLKAMPHRGLGQHRWKAEVHPAGAGNSCYGGREIPCGVLPAGLNVGVLHLPPATLPPGRLWLEVQQQNRVQIPSQSSRRKGKRGFGSTLNLFTIGFQLRGKCCSLPRKPNLCKLIYNSQTYCYGVI